ncbi:MAG TPA: hypothetical protein VK486_11455 [Thermoleophilaceae bacterium]|nr:hypothetical protein [Thermoleophilaceae bacterium]
MPRSSSVVAVLVLTVLALCLPFSFAIAASAFAQEPEPPTGEPQPTPEPPTTTPEEPPTTTAPTGEQPGATGGQLPRTGWDALLYLALGVGLLLGGARLRVIARIREAVQRVRRRSTEVALREALEPIRAARLSPSEPDPDAGPLHVEPSTPTARRFTGVAELD